MKEIRLRGNFSSGDEFKKTLNNLAKPFPKVETIDMANDFHFQTEFFELFPQMQKIKYIEECLSDVCLAHLDRHCPLLEDLSVDIGRKRYLSSKEKQKLHEKITPHLHKFLCLNPQIKSLSVPFLRNETFLDGLSENLPILESLEFRDSPTNFYNFNGHFEHLKRFRVSSNQDSDDVFERVPRKMLSIPQLEVFECSPSRSENVKFPYEFIANNPSIVKLRVFSDDPYDYYQREICPLRLASALPNLAEIDFRDWLFEIKNPISYITANESLEKFTFVSEFDDDQQILHFQQGLPDGMHANVLRKCSAMGTWIITLERSN